MHHHKTPQDKLKNLKFNEIISKESYYGVVWGGLYKDKKTCVIKMVRIANSLGKEPSLFQKNDHRPFKHKLFFEKSSMTKEMFLNEVQKQLTLFIRRQPDLGFLHIM